MIKAEADIIEKIVSPLTFFSTHTIPLRNKCAIPNKPAMKTKKTIVFTKAHNILSNLNSFTNFVFQCSCFYYITSYFGVAKTTSFQVLHNNA